MRKFGQMPQVYADNNGSVWVKSLYADIDKIKVGDSESVPAVGHMRIKLVRYYTKYTH